jgi:hypothetical protein
MSAIDLPALGPELSQHRYQTTNALVWFGLAGLCFFVWLMLTGIGVAEVVEKGHWDALAGTFCIGAVFGLPGFWLVWLGARGILNKAVVTIHEGGVSYRTRFRQLAWPWSDMTGLLIKRVSRRGQPASSAYDAVTLFKGKEQVSFDESGFGHIPDAMLDRIREETMVLLVPRFEAALKRGEALRFGQAALTADAVTVGKHRFAYGELGGFRYQSTDLVVFPKEGKARHARIFGAPNTHVLFQLLARRVPLRPKD